MNRDYVQSKIKNQTWPASAEAAGMADRAMNGAQALVAATDSGVDVYFANPGTSEMHFVAALDTNFEMRCSGAVRG